MPGLENGRLVRNLFQNIDVYTGKLFRYLCTAKKRINHPKFIKGLIDWLQVKKDIWHFLCTVHLYIFVMSERKRADNSAEFL